MYSNPSNINTEIPLNVISEREHDPLHKLHIPLENGKSPINFQEKKDLEGKAPLIFADIFVDDEREVENMSPASPRVRKTSYHDFLERGEIINSTNIDIHLKSDFHFKRFLFLFYGNGMAIFFICISLWTLFSYDFKRGFFQYSEYDIAYDILIGICMGLLIFENILSSFHKEELDFFFWLDCIISMSIIIDFTRIDEEIFKSVISNDRNDAVTVNFYYFCRKLLSIIRLLRLIKLYKYSNNLNYTNMINYIRKFKLFSSFSTPTPIRSSAFRSPTLLHPRNRTNTITADNVRDFLQQRKGSSINIRAFDAVEEMNMERIRKTKISIKVTILIIKKIILIIFMILLLIPFLGSNLIHQSDEGDYTSEYLKGLKDNINDDQLIIDIFDIFKDNHKEGYHTLLALKCDNPSLISLNFEGNNAHTLSISQIYIYETLGCVFKMSLEGQNRFESTLMILQTLFLVIILLIFSVFFQKDANSLIHLPFNRLIKTVNRIATNPVGARLEILSKRTTSPNIDLQSFIIENAIIKITNLLLIGFGELGVDLLTKTLRDKDGQLNMEVKGKKTYGIFGICDIKNFSDVSLILQEDVLIFVNTVAEIIHSNVDRYQGSPNKIFGDSFLVAWKFFDEDIEKTTSNHEIVFKNTEKARVMCDLALISFLKILANFETKPKIQEYNTNVKLNKGISGFKVKVGMGLNLGWAYEGAIGTELKIDVSYLSEDVSYAFFLEDISKKYKTNLCFSEHLYKNLSDFFKKKCRRVDRRDNFLAIEDNTIYTIEIDLKSINKERTIINKYENREAFMIAHNAKKQAFLQEVQDKGFDAKKFINSKKSLKQMFNYINYSFIDLHEQAFDKYIEGDWKNSKLIFEEALKLKNKDSLIENILNFMSGYNYKAPNDWKGVRI